MSAWIVSKAHIDALVQAMIVEGIVDMADATATGKELWRENHRSVNYRYDERKRTPDYTFEGVEAPLNDAVMAINAGCYDYQSCERHDYEKSKAHRLVTALRKVYDDRHGGDAWHYAKRWESEHGEIPWGIDNIRQAVTV